MMQVPQSACVRCTIWAHFFEMRQQKSIIGMFKHVITVDHGVQT